MAPPPPLESSREENRPFLTLPERPYTDEKDEAIKRRLIRVERFGMQSAARQSCYDPDFIRENRVTIHPRPGVVHDGLLSPLVGPMREIVGPMPSYAFGVQSHRVCHCHRAVRNELAGVDIMSHPQTNQASVAGVQKCGSVWVCPVCSAKISETRKNELQSAIDQCGAAGGEVLHLVLTIPHRWNDDLETCLENLKKAKYDFYKSKTVQRWFSRAGYHGRVDAFEITLTENGWHPHYHILIFLDCPLFDSVFDSPSFVGPVLPVLGPGYLMPKTDFVGPLLPAPLPWYGPVYSIQKVLDHQKNELQNSPIKNWRRVYHLFVAEFLKPHTDLLYSVWASVCVKAGLRRPSEKYGLLLQNGESAGAYVSKFGEDQEKPEWVAGAKAAMEVSKGANKSGRGHGQKVSLTPWDLLRQVLAGDGVVVPGDDRMCSVDYADPVRYSDLFSLYADCTKGKAQLRWSKGLKDLYKIESKTDEEIAENVEADLVHLGNLDVSDWRLILRYKALPYLLNHCEVDGWGFVQSTLLPLFRLQNGVKLDWKEKLYNVMHADSPHKIIEGH